MTFKKEGTDDFVELFRENKDVIKSFEGCNAVNVYRDDNQPNIFFTISLWDDVEALENYRSSPFFRETWSRTKALFSAKAEAWSLNPILQSRDNAD